MYLHSTEKVTDTLNDLPTKRCRTELGLGCGQGGQGGPAGAPSDNGASSPDYQPILRVRVGARIASIAVDTKLGLVARSRHQQAPLASAGKVPQDLVGKLLAPCALCSLSWMPTARSSS